MQNHIVHSLIETIPYLGQAGVYALVFHVTRQGAHAPCQTYLASSLLHLALALKSLV